MRSGVGWLLLLQLMAATGMAQSTAFQADDRHRLGVFVIGTLGNGNLKGTTGNRRFTIIGLSYSYLLHRNQVLDLRVEPEIVPLALLSEPFFKGTNMQAQRDLPPFTERKITYGLGANPLGLDFAFLPRRRMRPWIKVHGGFLYFGRNVLEADAAEFNFTVDGRTGLEFQLGRGRAVSFGYMFQHMSDAYEAAGNPGVDSHMLILSYSFSLGSHR